MPTNLFCVAREVITIGDKPGIFPPLAFPCGLPILYRCLCRMPRPAFANNIAMIDAGDVERTVVEAPSFGAIPFPLPELALGSMKETIGKRKARVSPDDDEDPREEAQVSAS